MNRQDREMYWTIFIWIGLFVGSALGSYVPNLWGESLFSLSSICFATVGGLLGISVGYNFSRWMDS